MIPPTYELIYGLLYIVVGTRCASFLLTCNNAFRAYTREVPYRKQGKHNTDSLAKLFLYFPLMEDSLFVKN